MALIDLFLKYGLIIIVIMLILVVAIFIAIGVLLNKLHRVIYGRGTALAFIPFCQTYLLGALTINKIAGWALIIFTFVTSKSTVTINGEKIDKSIIKNAGLRDGLSTALTILELGLVIYAIVKYNKLKKQALMGGSAPVAGTPNLVPDPNQTTPFPNSVPAPAGQVAEQPVPVNNFDPMSAVAPAAVTGPAVPQSNNLPDPNATIDSIIQTAPAPAAPVVPEAAPVVPEQPVIPGMPVVAPVVPEQPVIPTVAPVDQVAPVIPEAAPVIPEQPVIPDVAPAVPVPPVNPEAAPIIPEQPVIPEMPIASNPVGSVDNNNSNNV